MLMASYLYRQYYFVWGFGFEESEHFEGSVEIVRDSVVHDYKLSLRRGDFEGLVC